MAKGKDKKKFKKQPSIGQVFFGTPRQAGFTLLGIFVVIAVLSPGLAQGLIDRILTGLSPLITIGFIGLLVFGAFSLMFRRR